MLTSQILFLIEISKCRGDDERGPNVLRRDISSRSTDVERFSEITLIQLNISSLIYRTDHSSNIVQFKQYFSFQLFKQPNIYFNYFLQTENKQVQFFVHGLICSRTCCISWHSGVYGNLSFSHFLNINIQVISIQTYCRGVCGCV